MLNELMSVVYSWPVVGQFFFIIIIASLLTQIFVKLLDLLSNLLNTLPILFRGWPADTEIEVRKLNEDGDEDEESDKK